MENKRVHSDNAIISSYVSHESSCLEILNSILISHSCIDLVLHKIYLISSLND